MPKINCIETAKKAYGEALDNQDIESTYKALVRHQKMLEDGGTNILEGMNDYAKELSEQNEHANKEQLLQQLIATQSIIDNLQREQLFRDAGHTPQNSVIRSMMSKMTGSSWKVARSHDNTYSRKMQAADGFYREFAKDIQGELTPLFTSKAGQAELADAMYAHRSGNPVDSQYGKLASIIIKFQDRFYTKLRAVGVDITELEDRIAPNVHDATRMLALTADEKKVAAETYPKSASPYYEFAFQRWNKTILPLIDHDKVFRARNVDPENGTQVEEFQREAFDNLVNRGKVSQQNVNFANKFTKSRVYHWKNGESLTEYNNTFGNDAIQDAIMRELSHGFSMVEVIKDWGVNPDATIDRTLEVMDENPVVNQRTGKELESKKLKNIMRAMVSNESDYPGTVATVTNSMLAAEVVTKMGSVVPASISDLYNVASVARQAGKSRFESIPKAIGNFIFGMNKEDAKVLYRFVNTGISNKIGQVSRYYINPYSPSSIKGQFVHWMYKLNLLERWDNGNRGYTASVISQHIAENRGMAWEKLPDSDKEIMTSYGIEPTDWDLIRRSQVKIGKGTKEFITPDSIQDMSSDDVKAVLREHGVENPSETKVQSYKDAIERKLSTYFRDRLDHAVVNPDAYDHNLFTFGVPPERQIARAAIRVMTQFKKFGVSQFRKTVLPILREKGATTTAEMLYGGKSNWTGIGKMAVEMMALSYVVATVKNLSQGLSPPGLDKRSTWVKMLKNAAGVLELAVQIDPKDVVGSVAKTVAGPASGDVAKLSKMAYYFTTEASKGRGYKNTKKASYQFMRSNIPFNTFMTKWLWNHIFLNAMEDSAYPGKRQKDLRQVKKDTGARQLF